MLRDRFFIYLFIFLVSSCFLFSSSSDEEEWCPPLPERTYLMDGTEQDEGPGPCPPPRAEASSPTTSYSHQSTATLTPSPRDEGRLGHDISRLHHLDAPPQTRYGQSQTYSVSSCI